jgi:hypothetical protein
LLLILLSGSIIEERSLFVAMSLRSPSFSSTSIGRSSIGRSSQSIDKERKSPSTERDKGQEISALPFIVYELQSTWNTFLHFSLGAFCHQGALIGAGATFAVEKHSLVGKRGSLMVNPFGCAGHSWDPEYVAVKEVRHVSTNPARLLESREGAQCP